MDKNKWYKTSANQDGGGEYKAARIVEKRKQQRINVPDLFLNLSKVYQRYQDCMENISIPSE